MNESMFETDTFEGDFELISDHEEEFESEGADQELELASDLLAVSGDRELDEFFRKLFGKVRGVLNTPAGQQLKGLLRDTAKKALPLGGEAIGSYFGGQRGGAIGSQAGNLASTIFGLELEGLSGEDQELEMAKQFIRFATNAAKQVAAAPRGGNPRQVAQQAVLAAARRYAPGLIRIYDRRTKMHDLDRTLRSQESETDGEFEFSDETSITEEQETDLAAELLSVSEEAELDQFLGKLLKKAGRFVKPLAKTLLPIAGKVAGGFFGGPAGAAIGSKLGSWATNLFEVDMETIAPEEREMEVAKNFVRLATAAADQAAKAPAGSDPQKVARIAVIKAAQTHAPGLIRPKRCGAKTGRWVRRGNRIMVLGV